MGIGRGAVKLLIREALRKPLKGSLLTLGKQDVWITQKELEMLAKEAHFALSPGQHIDPLSKKPDLKEKNLISDIYLFTRLGFTSCKSIDYSPYEGADYLFDLNEPNVPSELKSRFDFVFDGGTLEHVFHLPNALNNLYQFLTINGRVFHISPSSNHIDHGFYMFSPTLFWDFYQANTFDLHQIQLIQHTPTHKKPWRISLYRPGCLNDLSYGGLDKNMYAIQCVATKTAESTGHRVPQQRNYIEETWVSKNSPLPVNSFKSKLKKLPLLYRFLSVFKRRKKHKLKVHELL